MLRHSRGAAMLPPRPARGSSLIEKRVHGELRGYAQLTEFELSKLTYYFFSMLECYTSAGS